MDKIRFLSDYSNHIIKSLNENSDKRPSASFYFGLIVITSEILSLELQKYFIGICTKVFKFNGYFTFLKP